MGFVNRLAQGSVSEYETSLKWPRLVDAMTRYVGFKHLAVRYVWKAALGEDGYLDLVREAFAYRHKKWGKNGGSNACRVQSAR